MDWWVWAIIGFIVLGMFGNSKEKEEREEARKANNEALRRRQEAEDYIMKSGDQEAIKTLMLARANPSNYTQVMSGGMHKGNDTLKTAIGVMTGVVAGNLIANAITTAQVQNALEDMQAEFKDLDLNPFDNDGGTDDVAANDIDDLDGDCDSIDV